MATLSNKTNRETHLVFLLHYIFASSSTALSVICWGLWDPPNDLRRFVVPSYQTTWDLMSLTPNPSHFWTSWTLSHPCSSSFILSLTSSHLPSPSFFFTSIYLSNLPLSQAPTPVRPPFFWAACTSHSPLTLKWELLHLGWLGPSPSQQAQHLASFCFQDFF